MGPPQLKRPPLGGGTNAMTEQTRAPLNWVQLLATLFLALAVICFPVWLLARGTEPHGGFLILIGGVLFSVTASVLWLLGKWVAQRQNQ